MLLTYLDESYTKARYFIAGLMVPEKEAKSLNADLDLIVDGAAWKYDGIMPTAELHGYDLFSGKRDWEYLTSRVSDRIGIYDNALRVVADHDVRIVIRSVDIQRLNRRYPTWHDHPHSIVLTHVIERVDEYAKERDEYTLLIADEVDAQDAYRRDLWRYQRTRTWGYRSRKITQVLDTIHFAPSSASRLVQAADLIAFITRRAETHVETDERAARATRGLWELIQPKIYHQWCWYP
ncbi:MAG: DUF3800 domain-containing protein [Actinobacteria bacterium]|nr:DUF3800 domain-containing protein [Actinomycetota bacterium]